MQIMGSVFRHKSVLRKTHSGHSRPPGENGALFRRTEEGYTNILLIFGFALDTPLHNAQINLALYSAYSYLWGRGRNNPFRSQNVLLKLPVIQFCTLPAFCYFLFIYSENRARRYE